MVFALARFHIPFCRPVNLSKILELLEAPEGLETLVAHRNSLSTVLKAVGTDKSGKPNFAAASQSLREYLSDGFNLMQTLRSFPPETEIPLIEFSWSSGLTKQPEKVYSFSSAQFDVGMVLLTLAYSQLNLCAQKMQLTEISAHETCKEVSNMLCQTAGILEYASQEIVALLDNIPATRRPLEFFSPATIKALSSIAMAEAEEIGAASAEQRQMKHSLVAKLMTHSADLYREAFHHLDVLIKNPDYPKAETGLISDYLTVFVVVKATILTSSALRHMGADAKTNDSHGLAVTFTELACAKMDEVLKVQKTAALFVQSGDSLATALSSQIQLEDSTVRRQYELYQKENETVYFEAVPKPDQVKQPNPTQLFKPEPFIPPTFAPFNTTLKQKKDDGCIVS